MLIRIRHSVNNLCRYFLVFLLSKVFLCVIVGHTLYGGSVIAADSVPRQTLTTQPGYSKMQWRHLVDIYESRNL